MPLVGAGLWVNAISRGLMLLIGAGLGVNAISRGRARG